MFSIKPGYSRNGGLLFSNIIGGNGVDKIYDFSPTPDNGTIIVGSTTSFGLEIEDVYIFKVNSSGGLEWNTTWGNWESDRGYAIIPTMDGNYVITGGTWDRDEIGDNVLFLKINGNGAVLSNNSYGGNSWDWGKDLVELPNGDILIAGVTEDFLISFYDCYLLRTTANGKLIWRRTIDVEGNYDFSKMIESKDGNYLLLGTSSNEFNTNNDIVLIKVNEDGEELWRRTYGADGRDEGSDIISVENGYLILGNNRENSIDGYDTIIIKININGNFMWSTNIGGIKDDKSYRIIKTNDNEYSIIGQTYNSEDDNSDAYYVTIDSDGKVLTSEVYGTSQWDAGHLIYQEGENIIIIGETRSKNRDIMFLSISPKIYELELVSDHSSASGAGHYYDNSVVNISVEDEIVYLDRDTRFVFSGWTSKSAWGVNSTQLSQEIIVRDNVTQIANWTIQYYLEIMNTEGLRINTASGWYDEGTELSLRVRSEEGKSFSHWEGTGLGSFSGNTSKVEITVLGPIVQVPIFLDQASFNLTLISEYGSTSGNGTYYEGILASFNVTPQVVEGRKGERFVFRGWLSDVADMHYGENSEGAIKLTENVVLTANWQKQYYVNISAGSDAEITRSGWYDMDDEITLTCNPRSGFYFERWEGKGIGSYSGPSSIVKIIVQGPISETALLSDSESFILSVRSEYGETTGSTSYYNGTNVVFNVYPEVIPLAENTRVAFTGWKSENEYGYTGGENPAAIILREDTVQEAIWSQQFFITSSDKLLQGWYDANASLPVDLDAEGVIVPRRQEFTADGEVISDLFKITGPLTLSSTMNYSLVTLAVAGISSSSIGFTAWSIMRRAAGLKGKRGRSEGEDNEPTEKEDESDKQSSGRFASLTQLASRFKRNKTDEVAEVLDAPPDDSTSQSFSDLIDWRTDDEDAE